ncbi:MAG: sigma-70 family RNA polymerase sigma factor, partial [Clostridia bacterium]|nr:sigma-70 family RNA polymerase sigma factor [Clostridia bacterium]
SRSLRDTAYHAMQIKERISNEKGYEPTVEEIAKEMDLKKEDVVIALEAVVDPVSFYEPVYSNGGDTIFLMDQIGSNESDSDWVNEIVLKESIKNLPEREKKILSMRFMRGMTQTEVANEIGISQAQVSRLEKNAIDSIKKS